MKKEGRNKAINAKTRICERLLMCEIINNQSLYHKSIIYFVEGFTMEDDSKSKTFKNQKGTHVSLNNNNDVLFL